MKHLFVAGAAVLVLAGCTSNPDSTEDATPVAVTSSDSACEVMPTQAPAGTVVFSVQNTGGQATEFYLRVTMTRSSQKSRTSVRASRVTWWWTSAGITSPRASRA